MLGAICILLNVPDLVVLVYSIGLILLYVANFDFEPQYLGVHLLLPLGQLFHEFVGDQVRDLSVDLRAY